MPSQDPKVLLDDVTLSASVNSIWIDIEDVLDFMVFVKIDNDSDDLVGECALQLGNHDGSVAQRVVWADGDDHEDIATGTDFEHIFDVVGCAAPRVRLEILRTSGDSAASGARATIFKKNNRR